MFSINRTLRSAVRFSSRRRVSFSTSQEPTSIIDIESFQTELSNHALSITKSLIDHGYYSTPSPFSILPQEVIRQMREQSIILQDNGRLEQSWSEKIDSVGNVTKFYKEGVFACEPDGKDYYEAPDLVTYMSVLLQTLPELLNQSCDKEESIEPFGLSVTSFNAKLAVTSAGGSVYPLHIDNPQGIEVGDTRKLTCILYLNPDYKQEDAGELRIFRDEAEENAEDCFVDIKPDGGRMVLFWSDEIPHQVLPTGPHAGESHSSRDRWALTLWIPTTNLQFIHNQKSKFSSLGDKSFQSNTPI